MPRLVAGTVGTPSGRITWNSMATAKLESMDTPAAALSDDDGDEPAGDEGFCFELCLPARQPRPEEPWRSTRAQVGAEGAWPAPDRRRSDRPPADRPPPPRRR